MKSSIICKCKAFWAVLAVFALCGAAQAQARNALLNRRNNRAANNNAPAASAPAATAVASASAAEGGEGDSTASDLNFRDAPVEMVFEVYGKLVDRTVLKDPATPSATITLESRPGQKLTKEEQIEAIEVVCEMNGIHFENYGEKFVRALPRKDAGKEGIPLFMDPQTEELKYLPMGKVVSVMINFKNISAQDEAQKALEGFKTNNGLLQVFERTNSILVTDTRQNIVRMLEIARAIDIATPVLENVYVRQIKNASASDIKTALEQIVTESQKELEKTGKAQQNAQASAANRNQPATQPNLLRRPGQNAQNNNQPATPTSLESLVTSVSDADRGLIRGKVLILADERSNKLVVITSKSNMDFFDRVIEQLDVETTPDVKVEVIRLKYADAEDVSDMINDLIGNTASAKNSSRANQNQNAKAGSGGNLTRNTPAANAGGSTTATRASANQRSGESRAGELSKDNVTVLADKRINGLVVMARTEDMPTLHSIIESMDVRLSQVLIETCIIEISLDDTLKTGIDWVMGGKVADSVFMNHGQMIGGGGGSTKLSSFATSGLSSSVTNLVTPIGTGLNYLMKSDKLNLAAVVEASKTDSRSKYLASPIVMTVDNKEAVIEATSARKFVEDWQTSSSSSYYGSGMPTPKYSSKDIGITLKITPKINPNGTVMLQVEEEYSQVAGTQSMLVPSGDSYDQRDVEIPATRKMSADIILEDGQSVILGGLTQKKVSDGESGIPILKDIPWVGKWLFGSTNQSETRSELLIFMTPYVLDDAEMAQAEAFRRKKALSDATPWDDGGWSASELADPIEMKEQMRRLKDIAKKQDEERKTKLAVEKWKMDRAKALESMDEKEREYWFRIHRDELEKEEREKFDAYVKEQTDLQELAGRIREDHIGKADRKLEDARQALVAEPVSAPEPAQEPEPVSVPGPAPEAEPALSRPASLINEL